MIVLFTDFGYKGPYVGEMKSAIYQAGYSGPVVDLMHDAPSFNPRASAYLLASLVSSFPVGSIFVCVIDPGVGSARQPLLVKAGGYTFVGPDNGLLNVIVSSFDDTQAFEITWQPEHLSASFHGRDLFAPIAVNAWFEQLNTDELVLLNDFETWSENLDEIIYIDDFGNCITGLRYHEDLKEKALSVKEHSLIYARTFSDVKQGEGFWYQNSNGLCEIAINQGSAQSLFGCQVGSKVIWE